MIISNMVRAITVRQPWAGLIVIGTKDVENRTWATNYRGPLLIHAGRKMGVKEREALGRFEGRYPEYAGDPLLNARGCILGYVELVDCSVQRRRPFNRWHEEGMIGWYLKNPVMFGWGIKYRGQLGLFDVPIDILPPGVLYGKTIQAERSRA